MMKKISLRLRLTLLTAFMMAGAAIILTGVSLFGAEKIFIQSLQQEFTVGASENQSIEIDPGEKVDGTKQSDRKGSVVVTPKTGEGSDDNVAVFEISLTNAGRRFNRWGIAGLFMVLVLGTGAAWIIAGRALKPVRELSETIGEIGGNDLSRRVDPCGRQDEIGQLAQSFNGMMDKVSASFERQKRFSASAAHELKTPLATMLVNLEVLDLDEHPSRERMEKALAVARTNTDRMIRLTDDLFRLTSDQESGMDEEVPVEAVFEEIQAELSEQLEARHLTVTEDVQPGIRLKGNRTMLYRALFNLVENAVKYSRGDGTISLTAEDEGDCVTIRIADTGIGIPQEELPNIFEPFYRVDRSRSRAVGGSGLGLALVKDIVEKHGGSIEAESLVGEWTVFTLRFPAIEGL